MIRDELCIPLRFLQGPRSLSRLPGDNLNGLFQLSLVQREAFQGQRNRCEMIIYAGHTSSCAFLATLDLDKEIRKGFQSDRQKSIHGVFRGNTCNTCCNTRCITHAGDCRRRDLIEAQVTTLTLWRTAKQTIPKWRTIPLFGAHRYLRRGFCRTGKETGQRTTCLVRHFFLFFIQLLLSHMFLSFMV